MKKQSRGERQSTGGSARQKPTVKWRNLPEHDYFLFARSYQRAAKKLARSLDSDPGPIPDFDLCPILSALRLSGIFDLIRPPSTPTGPVASQRFNRGRSGESSAGSALDSAGHVKDAHRSPPRSERYHSDHRRYPRQRLQRYSFTLRTRRMGSLSWRLRELQVRGCPNSVLTQISANAVECFVDLGVQFLAAEVPSEKCMCIRTPLPTLVEDVEDDIPLERR
jgi:hypothetical protein